MSRGPATSARVDIGTSDNVTWQDAVQFDPPPSYTGCTGPNWNMIGQNFRLDIKGNRGQTGPLLSITSPNQIIVQDPINRVLNFNVPPAVLTGLTGMTGATGVGLVPGEYEYDFLMYDGSSPPVEVMLMDGKFYLKHGVSGGGP